jgi:hypothetical protein
LWREEYPAWHVLDVDQDKTPAANASPDLNRFFYASKTLFCHKQPDMVIV